MFNLKKSNSGKVRAKLLATLLVLTLTSANFALVGSYIGEAIAAEINLSTQDNQTNSENVKFDIYLDEVDTSVKEKTADINSEELLIYISASVQGGGVLNNPVIELVDTNFEFKNNPEVTSVKLDSSIQSGKGITKGIPIVAKKDESYNLSLLNMQSQIRLTGEYIDENGKVTEIDTTKAVKITWTANELTKEDIVLSQDVITNKIYNIGGANKRVVQLLVKSNIQDNKAPVKSSTIEISNPKIGEITLEPVEVKVASYGTKATNGKTSWSSLSENGIEILNNPTEENIVSWTKNAEDIFVVTYIYDYNEEENVELSTFVSDVKNTVEVYGRTETALEKTNQLPLEVIEEKGNIVNLETSITENIYKGKMYIGEDTTYQETAKLYVPYSKLANAITIETIGDTVLSAESIENVEGVSTYYKETKINKVDAQKILGNEGTITVYNAEDKTTPIQEIILSEETEEEYYTVSYDEAISKIAIVMSAAKEEGTIEIINEKAIAVSNKDVVSQLTELKSNINLTVTDVNNNGIVGTENVSTAKLEEPKTTFDISLDKNTLSTQVENELQITTVLKTDENSNKLYSNPIIRIELPKEITEASLEGEIKAALYDNGLTLNEAESKVITNNAGNKELVIVIEGAQTNYNASAQNATITANLKVKTNSFMSDKNVEVTATCINDAKSEETKETVVSKENVKLISKSGLVTKSTIKIGENVEEKINQNSVNLNVQGNEQVEINTQNINNYGYALSNAAIIGTVPAEATLTSAVTTNIEGAVVYYSEETNPSVDSQSWKTEVTDLSKVKSFKIVAQSEIAQGQLLTTNYKYTLNQTTLNTQESTLKVAGTAVEKNKEETIKYVTKLASKQEDDSVQLMNLEGEEVSNGVSVELKSKTSTNTLYEGQIITYNIEVTNTTSEALNNVTLNYAVPEGAVLTELTYAQGTIITYTDDEVTKNKTWQIETLDPNKTVSREVTIKIKEGTTQIINNVSLVNSESSIIAELTTDAVQVLPGDLTVRLSRSSNMSIEVSEGSQIEYVVIVENNTDATMNNVTLKSKVPNKTTWAEDSEYNKDWTYNDQNKEITFTIDSLEAGAKRIKRFVVVVDNLSDNISKAIIDNTAVAVQNGVEYESNIYTSTLEKAVWKIGMTSEHSENLNVGDTVKYVIKVTNEGQRDGRVTIEDKLPEEIQVRKVTHYTSEKNKNVDQTTVSNVKITDTISKQQTLTIEIEGVVLDIDDNLETKQIANIAKIDLGNEEYLESNEIVNTIVNDEKPNGSNNDNSDNNPTEKPDGEQDNQEGTNSISGQAWLDEDRDGIKDEEETILQAVEVLLLDKEGKQVDKTTTSFTGTYKFTNVEQGEYTVVFKYDTSKYAVTKYQVSNATEITNSDVISKEIEIDGEKQLVAVTDTIKLQGKDITNIDLGLIENAQFDLSLNKYISKVVLTNKAGTTTYEYEDTNFAKVEISAKRIAGTVLLVEYELQVTNEGDVDGYVGDVIDYLPKGLVFTSETNKDWYMDGNGVLHNKAIADQVIKPGETKSVTLVLTKTLKSDSTGTIENIGEIGASNNLQGIAEKDSTAGNKAKGEDDISTASLIVSIATGSPIMYIGIVIASMLVLGLGIYIINKKILKVRI